MKANVSILILLVFLSCKEEIKLNSVFKINSDQTPSLKELEKKFVVKNIGDTLDVCNDVYVFYNKSIKNTSGRNLTSDGYNLGLKWQCVEFVKRYYYEHLNHKMPNSYGHAKDFFDLNVSDGKLNKSRHLLQFVNGSTSKPKLNDLVVFDGSSFNPYGHVAIISKAGDFHIEIIQQNVGRNSRDDFKMDYKNGKWTIKDKSILGWLRKE